MNEIKFTNEELLAYIIGDASSSLKNAIAKELELSPTLRKEINAIKKIKNDLSSFNENYFMIKNKKNNYIMKKNIARLGLTACLFFIIGIFSNHFFVNYHTQIENDVDIIIKRSQQTDWNKPQFNNII